jgi:hypothetical protein
VSATEAPSRIFERGKCHRTHHSNFRGLKLSTPHGDLKPLFTIEIPHFSKIHGVDGRSGGMLLVSQALSLIDSST